MSFSFFGNEAVVRLHREQRSRRSGLKCSSDTRIRFEYSRTTRWLSTTIARRRTRVATAGPNRVFPLAGTRASLHGANASFTAYLRLAAMPFSPAHCEADLMGMRGTQCAA